MGWRRAVTQLLRRRTAAFGSAIVAGVLAVALLAPVITPYDPVDQDLSRRMKPPGRAHVLGTDDFGRDILSRIMWGSRISLAVGAAAVVIGALFGSLVGFAAGYFGGASDHLLMRAMDIMMAFPTLLLAIALIAVLRPSVGSVIVVLAVTGWVTYARLIRAQVLALREREFIVAVHALGGDDTRVIVRHLFPNLVPILLAIATIQLAQFILAESALSFLGLGVPPTVPSWGGMINEGRDYIWNAWWIETFPGLAIVLIVSGVGLVGDWLRDRADPRLRL